MYILWARVIINNQHHLHSQHKSNLNQQGCQRQHTVTHTQCCCPLPLSNNNNNCGNCQEHESIETSTSTTTTRPSNCRTKRTLATQVSGLSWTSSLLGHESLYLSNPPSQINWPETTHSFHWLLCSDWLYLPGT